MAVELDMKVHEVSLSQTKRAPTEADAHACQDGSCLAAPLESLSIRLWSSRRVSKRIDATGSIDCLARSRTSANENEPLEKALACAILSEAPHVSLHTRGAALNIAAAAR